MRRYRTLLIGALAFTLAVFAGRWGKGLFTTAEFVHFSVNFPTNQIDENLTLSELGGPWARLAADEWAGYPPGGVLVWGTEGKVTVDLGRQGWIKNVVQPRSVLLSTHWLRNVGTRAYDISLDFEMCGFETRWLTFEKFWNDENKRFERPIGPTQMANMDWEITVPPERMNHSTICAGALIVRESTNRRVLTRLPIELINSDGDGA